MAEKKETTRVIHLRTVSYGPRQPDDFEPEPIDELLKKVVSNLGTAEGSLEPRPEKSKRNERHHFISDFRVRSGAGVSFLFCAYTPSEVPQSFDTTHLTKKNVDLAAMHIRDEDGNQRQLVHICHVLAFGHVVITDSGSGTGGAGALRDYLQKLFRREISSEFPVLGLTDTVGRSLEKEIRRGDGVRSVQLDLTQPSTQDGAQFGKELTDMQDLIGRTQKVRFIADAGAEDVLEEKDVIQAYHECETNEALSGIKVSLHTGETITLDKHLIKRPAKVGLDAAGQIRSESLIKAMIDYLFDLMKKHDGDDPVLTPDGKVLTTVIDNT